MLKRTLDVILAALLMVMVLPILLLVTLAILLLMGRPALFVQQRPGLNGKPFNLVKFRTMKVASYDTGGDSERLTRLGAFLRATSLDELPELWNILMGEMSLVGPRPLLMEYLPLYSCEQARRHDVRPGLTGWAQINGRNTLSWEERFKLDVWYVDNRSLWLDIKILLLTVKKVFLREGISAEGHVTMEPFRGSKMQ